MADAIVPYSFLGFFGVWAFTRNLTRATALLLVDYSCAIRLSTSISVISAMQEASMHNVLVKGGKHLESMKDANVIVFDKTGTLTHAKPVVLDVVPLQDYTREEVLKIAACLEEHFPHSVANAIVHQAEIENLKHREEHAEVKYVIAHGISTSLNGEDVIIGSSHFVFEDEKCIVPEDKKEQFENISDEYKTKIKERLEYFAKNPGYTVNFYQNKLTTTWAESTYSALFNNGITEESNLKWIKAPLTFYQKALIILTFSCAIIVLIQKRKNLSLELIFLVIIFLGGFCFHILWEAKSRYIIPYIVVIIPIASIIISDERLTSKLKRVFKRQK